MFAESFRASSKRFLICLGLMGVLACVGRVSSSPSLASDVAVIRARLEEQGRAENTTSASTVKGWLDTQSADGSWPDVDYANTNSANWLPAAHASRLVRMASAYRTQGNTYYQSDALAQAFSKGLDYWIAAKLVSSNWWYNDIGVPLSLGPALLLMQPKLAAAQLTAAAALLPVAPKATGENLVWYSFGAIHRALLESNTDHLVAAVEAIKGTLVLTTSEGIQVDGTFYQHGNQIYNGGYGLGFVSDLSKWAAILAGTSLAIEGSPKTVLENLVLDGTGWMMRFGTLDYSAVGREISRKGNRKDTVLGCLDRLITAGSPRLSEMQALRDHVAGSGEGPLGHKHFWRGDYTVHRETDSLVSLRLFSVRTVGPECMNNENLLGIYQAFGMTLIYRDGLEYTDIFPAWNWMRLPGTTLEQTTSVPAFTGDLKGSRTFVGGVSDGQAGVSAFDQAEPKSSVTAHKSWFFFGEGFLALGAGIQSTGTGPVFTTLNQCLLRGPVRVDTGGAVSTQTSGEVDLDATEWVLHDGVGYVFPSPTKVHLKNAAQSGDWNLINRMYASASLSCDLFLLGLDHGVAPTDASYAYVVLPGTDEAGVAAFAAQAPLTILSNTPSLQAARHSGLGLSGIAFFTPGSVSVKTGLTVATDTPVLLLLRETSTGLEVNAADPTQSAVSVQFTLSGKFTGTGATWDESSNSTRLTIPLPTAEYAGSSVKISLSK
jgi:chondroitin AC lyase